MPQQDRTGPRGEGSRTGQGLGKCGPKQKDVDQMDEKEVRSYLKQMMAGLTHNLRSGRGMRGGQRMGNGRGSGRGMGRNHGAGFGRGFGRNLSE